MSVCALPILRCVAPPYSVLFAYTVRQSTLDSLSIRPCRPHRKEPMMLTMKGLRKMNGDMTTKDRKMMLSTLWIFVTLNYLYADVLTLFADVGPTAPEEVELVSALSTPEMLLVAAIYLEMAMVMIVLSRLLKYGMNRWANIIIAPLHILGVLASLFVMTPPIFYPFFVAVEVVTLLFIVRYAWSWKDSNPVGSAA